MNYIGLDLGTGAIKGVCWNEEGGILSTASERVEMLSPQPNRRELDPQKYLRQVIGVIARLSEAAGGQMVGGVSFAAASGNTLLCDGDGRPLTNIISWLDTRLDWMPPVEWKVRETGGWPRGTMFPLMHLEWLKRNQPEMLRSAQIAMNNDWVCWMLTGKHVLDSSNTAPFYLYDQSNRRYNQACLDYYGITTAQLPQVVPPGTAIGTLKSEYAVGAGLTTDTVIAAGSFDHPCGARAVGVTNPGDMLLSCGTSWVGFYPVARRDDVPLNELCDSFESDAGGCWGAMFSVPGVGIELEEFVCKRYGGVSERYQLFNREALSDASSPARQEMLSVIGRFRELYGSRDAKRIVLSGGPSEGDAWPRLLREVMGLPIEVSKYTSHTGAVGAAMLAVKAVRDLK